ncbi:MAG: peptidase T [Promethearchaeota archaeon]
MKGVVERFLRYVKIHTTSSEDSETFPTTEQQFDLANILVEEMKEMGISDAKVDEFCIVTGTIPKNIQKELPTVAFVAHLDTSPSEPGNNVKPQIIDYKGGEIPFPNNPEMKITPEENPELNSCIGQQIIIADGTTLLGADDKAGVAAIMTMAKKILEDPSIPHGTVKLMFTPDEEVGKGTTKVEVKGFGADFAYTVDGGKLGEFEIENFNATNGYIEVKGYNVHPGSAYGKMINAVRYVDEIIALFPKNEGPETTKDRQGYYHPMEIHGDENSVKIKLLIRDFDEERLLVRMKHIENGIQKLQEMHPEVEYLVKLTRSYKNMKPILDQYPQVIKIAEDAYKSSNVEIKYIPIRGGTDGATLSYKGLPCPNLFTGGGNFHSKKEFLSVYGLEKAVEVLTNIVKIIAS